MARNRDNQYLLGLFCSTNAEHNDGSQSNKSCTPNTGSKAKWLLPRLQLIPHQAGNNPNLHKLQLDVGAKAAPCLETFPPGTAPLRHIWWSNNLEGSRADAAHGSVSLLTTIMLTRNIK